MEENKGKKVVLRKIHLDSFITILTDLYESGVNYIDLHGTNDTEQDVIDISFNKEYTIFSEDNNPEEEDLPPGNIKLSDDNLNQLL